jgi:hypothetical protein
MPAPHCYMIGRSSRLFREAPGAYSSSGGSGKRGFSSGPVAESTSRSTFHNAFGRLQPTRHSVGSRFFPAARYRRESPLFAFTLEAQPAVAVFTGDSNAAAKRSPPSFRRAPTIRNPRRARRIDRGPSISLSSFRGSWCHEPHLPASPRRVEKGPITHREVLRRQSAPQSALTSSALHSRCQKSSLSE